MMSYRKQDRYKVQLHAVETDSDSSSSSSNESVSMHVCMYLCMSRTIHLRVKLWKQIAIFLLINKAHSFPRPVECREFGFLPRNSSFCRGI